MTDHGDDTTSVESPGSDGSEPELDAFQVALELHRNGRLDAARTIYERIVKVAPDHADALHFLGMLSHQQGDTDQAIALVRRAVAADATYASAFNNLGNLYKLQGCLGEAADAYGHALALAPNSADTYNNLGTVQNKLGQYEAALASLERAIELAPNHPEAYHNLGNVLTRLNRLEEGITAYKKAIGIRPYSGPSYGRLGSALASLGRVDEALEVYRTWLEKEPNNAVPKHMIAACTGNDVPARTSDEVVKTLFDGFSETFDDVLGRLQYRAPALLGDAILETSGPPRRNLDVLDAGCGTGLSGIVLRPYARHLVGVDLSKGMLQKAKERQIYDELVEGELTSTLESSRDRYDLMMSADTLCYFGALESVLRAAAGALREGGLLAFTVEAARGDDAPNGFRIQPHGRYSHTEQYLRDCLERATLAPVVIKDAHLRLELRVPVRGFVVCARKPAPR